MSTNISKQKREDLLNKIKDIRTFISAAPQDENTGNLLSYLSDLEKDVNGKKYGLVFEEHREEIDLIYIDPPYNTSNKDFIYDDIFVDSEDSFKNSNHQMEIHYLKQPEYLTTIQKYLIQGLPQQML